MPESKKRKKVAKKKNINKVKNSFPDNAADAFSEVIDYAIQYTSTEIAEKNDSNLAKIKEWGIIEIPDIQYLSAFTKHLSDKMEIHKRVITIIALHQLLDVEDRLMEHEKDIFAEKIPLYTSLIHTFYNADAIPLFHEVSGERLFSIKLKDIG